MYKKRQTVLAYFCIGLAELSEVKNLGNLRACNCEKTLKLGFNFSNFA